MPQLHGPFAIDAPRTRRANALEADGAMTLEEVGVAIGVTRERVRQIEIGALRKLRERLAALGVTDAAFAHAWCDEQAPGGGSGEGPWHRAIAESPRERRVLEEADAFADRVVALRIAGVPLRYAWSLANGCEPPDDEVTEVTTMATTTNGTTSHTPPPTATVERGEAMANDESTEALVRDVEEARAKLRARRDELRAELAIAERALAVDDERAPSAGHDAGHPPATSARKAARKPPERKAMPPARARTTSRTAQVLAHLQAHPGARTADIAAALQEDSGVVSGVLYTLRASGKARATVTRPKSWTATATV